MILLKVLFGDRILTIFPFHGHFLKYHYGLRLIQLSWATHLKSEPLPRRNFINYLTSDLNGLMTLRFNFVCGLMMHPRQSDFWLLAEVGITGATWMRSLSSIRHVPPIDFRVTRPPWLRVEGSANNPANQIERLAFFGWVWEPYHDMHVSSATKDDNDGIDKRQWA
jgi:hypothetical protein